MNETGPSPSPSPTMRLFMTVGPTILAVGAALTVLVARYGSPMDAEAGMSSGIAPSTAAGEPSPSQGPLPEAYARTALPAPDFTLVDQHGAEVTLSKLDRPVVLSFAFAHCRTMCPLLIRTLQEWSKRDDAAGARGAELLVVTLDPEHDTPETLPELAKAWSFGPRRRVLSGKVDSVLAVLEAYKVPRVKDATTGEITHPGLVYVVDTEGKIAYTLNNPSVQWLTDAVLRAQPTRTAAADAPVKSGG